MTGGPLQAREAFEPSAPFQARFGRQSDSLFPLPCPKTVGAGASPPRLPAPSKRRKKRASLTDIVRRRHVHETGASLTTVHVPKAACCPFRALPARRPTAPSLEG